MIPTIILFFVTCILFLYGFLQHRTNNNNIVNVNYTINTNAMQYNTIQKSCQGTNTSNIVIAFVCRGIYIVIIQLMYIHMHIHA